MRLPYPGLRPFLREESDIFFGREGCVDQMVDRLAATRFLAVLGASGSGKSSLVITGLLDALEIGLHARAGSRWKIAYLRPGSQPMERLARALLSEMPERDEAAAAVADLDVHLLSSYLRRGPRSVAEWCRDGHLPPGTNLLILVDQFEELFRYGDYAGREETEAFVALLLESARAPDAAIHVTITMRSEYLGACALIPGLAEQINSGLYLAPRMTREEVREAIEGPAGVCGFSIEPALVNRLLNDLSSLAPWEDDRSTDQLQRLSRRADQLPLMQHVLNRLWLRAAPEATGGAIRLTLADYDRIGGLTGALDAHAREVLESLPAEDQPLVETVFRGLVDGTSLANAVRRPCRFGELVAMANGDRATVGRIIDAFRAPGCNFLTPPAQIGLEDETIVDISHESLIRQWSSLSEWLEKEARAAVLWRRLAAAADSHSRGEGSLLSGLDLANFSAWWEREPPNAAWARRYGGDFEGVREFLDRSRAAEKERLDQSRARDRRERRRLYYGLAICIALAAIASTFGLLAMRSEGQLTQANLGLKRAVESRNASLEERNASLEEDQKILNEVTGILGKEENFERIGAELLEKDLLTNLKPDFERFASMTGASGLSHDEIAERSQLGRLIAHDVSRDAALPILEQTFIQVEKQNDGRHLTDSDILDFEKLGSILASTYEDLGAHQKAKETLNKLSKMIPDSNVDVALLSPLILDAYDWYLDAVWFIEPWSADNEWLRAVSEREVAVTDRLMAVEDKPWSHYIRSIAYARLYRTLWHLQRNAEADTALDISVSEAKEAYDRFPQQASYLQNYALALKDRAQDLANKGDLAAAEQSAQHAADLLHVALAISPDSSIIVNAAAEVFDELGTILQKQKDLQGALARKLDTVGFAIKLLERDPLNRSVADDALTRTSNLISILGDVSDYQQQFDRCLDLARHAVALAVAHPEVLQHSRLAGATLSCASEAEKSLAAGASAKSGQEQFDQLIVANADFFVKEFRDTKLDPEDVGEFYEQMGSIIERLQKIAEEQGDFTTAGNYAQLTIDVLDKLRPQFDYDMYTLPLISFAHRDIGDYRHQAGDIAGAAQQYRICSDPDLVAYPETDCMKRLVKLIQAGELGSGHEDEVKTLQDRIPLYEMRRFTVDVSYSGGKFPFNIYVTMPPKGYRGIDNQVKWLKDVKGYDIPAKIAENFRQLDDIARANHESIADLAARLVAQAEANDDADKPDLDQIAQAFKDGKPSAALDMAEKLYRNPVQGDAVRTEKRKAATIAAIATGLEALAKADNLAPFQAALSRTRSLVAADVAVASANRVRSAFAELLQKVASARSEKHDYASAAVFETESVGIRRQEVGNDPNDEDRRAGLVNALGHLSWYSLFTHQWKAARAAADEALTLDPSKIVWATNAAHARMFEGDTDAARKMYLDNRGEEIPGHGSWEKTILDDFAEFRRAGLSNPLMAEIEKDFSTPAPKAAQ